VQPNVPQNPTSAETSSKDLLPKGPGANPALAALAGNDNVAFRPAVKHVISTELTLYFNKIQAALLDDNPDEEVNRLRAAALESVRSDPGLHQLLPYFVNFITNQVTHRLDDTFVLRQMMELTEAIIANPNFFLDPYAASLCAAVLTCLMGRKLGADEGVDALREQYQLRELSASLLGKLARSYGKSNALLRPKLTRTCLKFFLDPTKTPAVLFGAISGIAAAGGPEAVRVLVLPNLKSFDQAILQPLQERREAGAIDFEALVGGIVKAIQTVAGDANSLRLNGAQNGSSADDTKNLEEFLGPIIGQRIASLGNRALNTLVLDARNIE
jgi:transcription initiation factor TFIID subunit 6